MKSRKNILLEVELNRIIMSVRVWGVKYVGCVGGRDQIQGLVHAWRVLYHWVAPPLVTVSGVQFWKIRYSFNVVKSLTNKYKSFTALLLIGMKDSEITLNTLNNLCFTRRVPILTLAQKISGPHWWRLQKTTTWMQWSTSSRPEHRWIRRYPPSQVHILISCVDVS